MSHVFSQGAEDLRDFYQILGVPQEASAEEIRRAYRSLALKYHPDRNSGSREAEERFKELAEAFRTLSDPDRRALIETKLATFGEHPSGLGKFTRSMFARDLRRVLISADAFVEGAAR